ncbi:MAG: hypothetical protein ACTSQI_20435 [Candidatus Helarchaeota archaeon]
MWIEILLCLTIVLMGIAIYSLAKAAIKTRKTFSLVYKILIGFIVITIAVIDHVLASYFVFIGWWAPQIFITYRFFWELFMGLIGFYIFFDIICRNINYKHLWKFGMVLFAVILGEAYFIYFFQNYSLFTNINFFDLLFYFYNTQPILFLILGGAKLFSVAGVVIFCFYICYVVLKNKFYSRRSKILLTIGSLAFIDVVFNIPLIESTGGELTLVYSLWSLAYIFIIFANLSRINFEAISGIHEILISYKDGRPLYTTGSEKLDPELVTGIISAITSISNEVFNSKKRVRSIDHQDKKILFSYGEFIITSVVTDDETQILFNKVDSLTRDFERHFHSVLYRWNGNLEPFASAWFIVDKIFPIIEWEHKKSVIEFTNNLRKKTEGKK